MSSDHALYVLTLTENGVALHKTIYPLASSAPTTAELLQSVEVEEILLEHLPANLIEALRYDALDGQLQMARPVEFLARRYTATERPANAPGHEPKPLPEKQQKYLRRYLRELDHAVCDLLSGSAAPLHLAGDAEICALYSSISEYPQLVPYPQAPHREES